MFSDDALDCWVSLNPTKEVARLSPELYRVLGFHLKLEDEWEDILNFEFWNFSWPYMAYPKRKPHDRAWTLDD